MNYIGRARYSSASGSSKSIGDVNVMMYGWTACPGALVEASSSREVDAIGCIRALLLCDVPGRKSHVASERSSPLWYSDVSGSWSMSESGDVTSMSSEKCR